MNPELSRRAWFAIVAAGYVSPAWALSAVKARVGALAPRTPLEDVSDRYFGTEVIDRYRWMEAQPKTARWNDWLKAQGEFARATLDSLPGRAAIASRLEQYTAAQDMVAAAVPAGGKVFVQMRPAGKDSHQLFVRDADGGAQRLLYDPAAGRTPGAPTRAIDWWTVAPGGRHIALGVSEGGSEISVGMVCEVATGALAEITRIFCRPGGWTSDGRGFFYFRLRRDAVPGTPDYGKGGSAWLHKIGTDPAGDLEVLRAGEGPDFETIEDDVVYVTGAAGSDWVLGRHAVNGINAALLYISPAADVLAGKPTWRKLGGRAAGMLQAELHGDHVYLLANGRAGNGELLKIDARTGDVASASVALAAGGGVIGAFSVARDGLYVHDVRAGQSRLRRVDWQGKAGVVTIPRSGSLWAVEGNREDGGALFQMDDLTLPAASFRIDPAALAARQLDIARRPAFDTAQFATTRAAAPARDGALVGIEILHRKDARRDGRNPTMIIAYGSYGIILDPGFQARTLAFIEAGGVIVYAHVRGGGEQGEAWHKAGMKAAKPNTWRDAIDTAEYLIKSGWTGKRHLAIWGTSAGGIMVGRAITERPDLFAAAIGEVGMFNMLRFELTANGPGNDAEFGTVKREPEFRALKAMDAYHAVKDGVRYPATLLITGANDLRVEPWQVGKFAARLQAASTNPASALLRVDYDAGHFSATRQKANALALDVYSFVLAHTR